MASSSLESSILANNSSSPTTSTTTNFSRRSATYTASTFAAFEYGSNYEYHGSYNTKGDEENNDGAENDEESPPSSRITFDDLDELLEGLNEEELKELSIIDPDVNCTFKNHIFSAKLYCTKSSMLMMMKISLYIF